MKKKVIKKAKLITINFLDINNFKNNKSKKLNYYII